MIPVDIMNGIMIGVIYLSAKWTPEVGAIVIRRGKKINNDF